MKTNETYKITKQLSFSDNDQRGAKPTMHLSLQRLQNESGMWQNGHQFPDDIFKYIF